MYRCYCCGRRFSAPVAWHPWPAPRFTREYGDAAVMVCPHCKGESFDREADDRGLV